MREAHAHDELKDICMAGADIGQSVSRLRKTTYIEVDGQKVVIAPTSMPDMKFLALKS